MPCIDRMAFQTPEGKNSVSMRSTCGGGRNLVRLPVQETSAERIGFTFRVARSVCGLRAPQPRITIARFRDFYEYMDRTNVWRHLTVIMLTPLPSVAITITLAAIPLQDPALGVWKNTGAVALHMGMTFLGVFGFVIMFRSSNHVPHSIYSNADVVIVCTLTAVPTAVLYAVIGCIWRFPVPFLLFIGSCPVLAIFALTHMLLLRPKHQTSFELRTPLNKFSPFVIGQMAQGLLYVALSAVFTTTTEKGILVATGVVVAAKFSFRRLLRNVTSHPREDSNQLAVAAVEICASLYLSLILKRSVSYYAMIGLLTVDIVHTAFVILAYMDKKCAVPRRNMIQATRGILGLSSPTWDDCELDTAATAHHTSVVSNHAVVPMAPPSQADGVKKTAVMTLEMLHVAETVVLIEYLECVVPATSTVLRWWHPSSVRRDITASCVRMSATRVPWYLQSLLSADTLASRR